MIERKIYSNWAFSDNESLPFDKDFRFFDTKKGRHENCPLKVLKGNKDE